MSKLILASASPRRQELLTQVGLMFLVEKSTCEENTEETIPYKIVCDLSRQKAIDVYQRHQKEQGEDQFVVIGADTIVSCDGEIMGKPEDERDAMRMIQKIAGKTHEVYTGVTLCLSKDGKEVIHTFFEETEVTCYPMTTQQIEDYVKTGEPLDKAGAYGIQGRFAAYIKCIQGDYYNVVGLPLARLVHELSALCIL